uniref:Putative manganese-dependent inorganic pyrophosphatase n=1 Tax=Lygus hesperus TaxID=30085 RepID=A0A0A9W1A0_LYGHE
MNWVIHRYTDNRLTVEAAERLLITLDNVSTSKTRKALKSDSSNLQEIITESKNIDIYADIERNKGDNNKLQPLFTKLDAMLDVPDIASNLDKKPLPKVLSNILKKNIDNEEVFQKVSKVLVKLSGFQLEESGAEQEMYIDPDVLAAQVE